MATERGSMAKEKAIYEATYLEVTKKLAKGKKTTKKLPDDPTQSWRTPPDLFKKLDEIFGFTVDAFANEKNHLLPKWWEDCESEDWSNEIAFCNPPFGYVDKFLFRASRAQMSLWLCMANRLVSPGVNKYPPALLIIPARRLKFIPPDGIQAKSPTSGTVLLVYGKVSREQIARLETIGSIWTSWK